MRTIFHSLAWKEWHEHKWKLAAITAILVGVTAMPTLLSDRDSLGLAWAMLLMCTIPLAVFVGLGTAANERSRGTLSFLQALPVPLRQVALMKLIFGWATIIVPVFLAAFSLYAWSNLFDMLGVAHRDAAQELAGGMGPLDTGAWYLNVALFCSLLATSLFIWSSATGVNRKDEISAGAVALAAMLGWSLSLWLFRWSISSEAGTSLDKWLLAIAFSATPGGITMVFSGPDLTRQQIAVAAWIALIVHLLLAAWYIRRFGEISEREIISPQIALRDGRRKDWLGPPRRSPLSAIAWKQFRESGPVALVGVVGIVGLTLFSYAIQIHRSETQLADTYTFVSASLGLGIALVIGIGVVLHDVSPQLNLFWRSRPISPDLWIGVKFVTGLAIVLLSLYAPFLLLLGWSGTGSVDPDAAPLLPALHIAVFSAAVATTCLVRQAMYAAILSIAALFAGIYAAWFAWFAAGLLGAAHRPSSNWYDPFGKPEILLGGMLTCLVLSTLVAWLAVRYDWGRKSRY